MLQIKKITPKPEQVYKLQAISRQTFKDTFGAQNTDANMKNYLHQAYNFKTLLQELKNPNSFFYFAKKQNQIVGYLKININQAQTENQGRQALEVERIYVKVGFKKKGIGSKLFQKALQIASLKRKNKIWLGVWEHNEPAFKFYKKLGFKQVGDHVFTLGKDRQRDLILEKNLHQK